MPIITTEKVTSSQIGDGKSYKLAFSLVTSLFFLWGLANILNSALISHFQPVFTISRPVALLIETAFYLGYFFVAIPAGRLVFSCWPYSSSRAVWLFWKPERIRM
jgi:FHS family L-fucose permease-like MFS transporter